MASDLEVIHGRLVGAYETAKMLKNQIEGTIDIADKFEGEIDQETFDKIERQRGKIVEVLGPRSIFSDSLAECLERLETKIAQTQPEEIAS